MLELNPQNPHKNSGLVLGTPYNFKTLKMEVHGSLGLSASHLNLISKLQVQ